VENIPFDEPHAFIQYLCNGLCQWEIDLKSNLQNGQSYRTNWPKSIKIFVDLSDDYLAAIID